MLDPVANVNSFANSADIVGREYLTEFNYMSISRTYSKCTKVQRYDQCDYVIANATRGTKCLCDRVNAQMVDCTRDSRCGRLCSCSRVTSVADWDVFSASELGTRREYDTEFDTTSMTPISPKCTNVRHC